MKEFMRNMGQWILIRVIGGLAVTLTIGIMWASFMLTQNLNFLP